LPCTFAAEDFPPHVNCVVPYPVKLVAFDVILVLFVFSGKVIDIFLHKSFLITALK